VAPLFLIGFMAAGKTSVGRAIATATGRRFIDLDEVIALGGIPVATLVARDELDFRKREAAALGSVIAQAGDGPVIATGGGAAVYGDNLARMRAAGLVVALGVDVAEAERRAASEDRSRSAGGDPEGAAGGEPAARAGASRPLLASARALAAVRAPVYRRAHAVVDTTGRSIAEVASRVRAVERTWQSAPDREVTIVALDERSYPISVGAQLDPVAIRGALGEPSKLAIITDTSVARHWLPSLAALTASRRDAGVETIAIDPGEASKSFATYARICEQLVAAGLDRGSAIVALGGGVVGDLAGFVAATLYRGITVVQVPTTIVAMTDAAIGGKTAVDLPAGKNLVGAIWQPRLVVCALETLLTLPARERRAGFGELWKYALLDGRDLWSTVDRSLDRVQGGDRRTRRARAHRSPCATQPRPHRRPCDRVGDRHAAWRGGRSRARRGVSRLGRGRGHAARSRARGRRRASCERPTERSRSVSDRRRPRAPTGRQEADRNQPAVHRDSRRGGV
jgi:shikimate kinase/3-dehydroquinate synthase